MRNLCLGILFLFTLLACKQEKEKFLKNIPEKVAKNNFFKTIDSVRLISYPNREIWDRNNLFDYDKTDIKIPKEKIIDEIIISKNDFSEIKKILEINEKDKCIKAACYMPRHLFEFYKNGEIIGNYEVCLECGGLRSTKNLEFLPNFCIRKGVMLKTLFKKLGLKNYGEGSPILDKLER